MTQEEITTALRKAREACIASPHLTPRDRAAAGYALAMVEVELGKLQNAALSDKMRHLDTLKRYQR